MAAIKSDRGDVLSATHVEGHGEVLSRIDAVGSAVPVLKRAARYFFGQLGTWSALFSAQLRQVVQRRFPANSKAHASAHRPTLDGSGTNGGGTEFSA